MMQADILSGGFTEAPQQAARAFRACLEAMARPGRIQRIEGANPPAPLSPAAGAVLLTLVDTTTPLYLAPSHDLPVVRQWIAFHCGAPLAEPAQAVFALGSWAALQPLSAFPIGTPQYPDRSTTPIVEMEALSLPNAMLRGPGIEDRQPARLPEIEGLAANRKLFPLGHDFFFTAGFEIAALPRSTEPEAL